MSDSTLYFTDDIQVDALLDGSIAINGEIGLINSNFSGDVYFWGDTFEIGQNATVEGDLKIVGASEVRIGGTLMGSVIGDYGTMIKKTPEQ